LKSISKNPIKYSIYSNPTESVGRKNQKWKIGSKVGQNLLTELPLKWEDLVKQEYDLKQFNRFNCPTHLDPHNSSFDQVAIYALLRLRLAQGTIEKHLRYARFMETHAVPVDFRNPTYENFLRHMDYREQVEHATPCALKHEWKCMQMFLRVYGIPYWDYKAPSVPPSHKRILPYPETVHQFFNFRYSDNEYENAVYQYLYFFGFMVGVRIPSELVELKLSDVSIDERHRGYVIVTEAKKHRLQRTIIPEKSILSSKVHKSLKNYIDHWRPKVANELSEDALFLQPSGKPFNVRRLGQELSIRGKQIWPHFQPYDMRHWCAVARLIKTKVETGNFDCYTVKNWLGHSKLSATEGYIRYAEQYYRELPVDWISYALKLHAISARGKRNENQEKNDGKNQQTAILGSVAGIFSEKDQWARQDLNLRPTGYEPVAPPV
jgi:integrase